MTRARKSEARHPLMDAPMPTEWPTKAEIEAFTAEIDARRSSMLAAVDGRAVEFDCETAGAPMCWPCAMGDPHQCNHDNLPPEVHAACETEARRLAVLRDGAPCHDCAFLRDSEETRQEVTERLARQADPFHCHQAMPLDGKGRAPADGDFKPRDHRAYPICAGWAAARAARRARVLAARAAGKLWRSLVRPPMTRERVLLQLLGVTPRPSEDRRRLVIRRRSSPVKLALAARVEGG